MLQILELLEQTHQDELDYHHMDDTMLDMPEREVAADKWIQIEYD